jgi:hypothetical protein
MGEAILKLTMPDRWVKDVCRNAGIDLSSDEAVEMEIV